MHSQPNTSAFRHRGFSEDGLVSLSGSDVKSRLSPQSLSNLPDDDQILASSRRVPLDRKNSVVDDLLFEIYDRWYNHRYRFDSSLDSDTITEHSASDAGFSRGRHLASLGMSSACSDADETRTGGRLYNQNTLRLKDKSSLAALVKDMSHKVTIISSRLVRQLKRRDHRLVRLQKNCDILTAVLQAASQKRRQDTQLKFTLDPKPENEESFQQWKDAMKGLARLPLGLPIEFRARIWVSLADRYIMDQKLDWSQVTAFAFNDKCNPDDDRLGLQIVKDLHRTGCDRFCSEEDQATLKRVLLAYARWNKRVGYCQGFNVIAALILEVTGRNEDNALKIMVYLVDHILPDNYFSENLQALSVDITVFRDLMRVHIPHLAHKLECLQQASNDMEHPLYDSSSPRSYEPPLTNVFTMQWFLTLFATCLPPAAVLRVWDSILLEGSEIMFRTALAIWAKLLDFLKKVRSVDQFYSTMRTLTQEMAEGLIFQPDRLMNRVYSLAPFPFPDLAQLRENYTYTITPFSAAVYNSGTGGDTGDELDDDDGLDGRKMSTSGPGCFSGILRSNQCQSIRSSSRPEVRHTKGQKDRKASPESPNNQSDISQIGPGAVSTSPGTNPPTSRLPGSYRERMTTDISALQSQYHRLKNRQRRAALLLNITPANADRSSASSFPQNVVISPPMINHLAVVPRKQIDNDSTVWVGLDTQTSLSSAVEQVSALRRSSESETRRTSTSSTKTPTTISSKRHSIPPPLSLAHSSAVSGLLLANSAPLSPSTIDVASPKRSSSTNSSLSLPASSLPPSEAASPVHTLLQIVNIAVAKSNLQDISLDDDDPPATAISPSRDQASIATSGCTNFTSQVSSFSRPSLIDALTRHHDRLLHKQLAKSISAPDTTPDISSHTERWLDESLQHHIDNLHKEASKSPPTISTGSQSNSNDRNISNKSSSKLSRQPTDESSVFDFSTTSIDNNDEYDDAEPEDTLGPLRSPTRRQSISILVGPHQAFSRNALRTCSQRRHSFGAQFGLYKANSASVDTGLSKIRNRTNSTSRWY